ncbi:methylase involved in ubiquinone/menaquinone biosynthesis [Cryptobacterium curtum DSM 15641]|uniref:Methylase involved in ubiquinone/menaquinone biosynthesis n=1 Tax=Cryptobacterium curtum (strain ATCC 700683 / DSM 15641 / CCUG 43107 / 12-3) TaxID=469378 RepID=C7MMP2_CRYCD|nr:class I SAM-dependent methyltransferase [Cryptobacterium curtum]ACU94182.1 methylase involved in ubiquinone/menaquinone biosynthesis [Cryptobacterium curtum DSM 15641]
MKKTIWDWYAPFYQRAMIPDKKAYQWMYDHISHVVVDKTVLEIATGPGLLAKHIASAAKTVTATDYSASMIKEAQKGTHPENLIFEVADATHLPYAARAFDVVIIANALHIMKKPDKALQEIRRVLKNDGLLIAPNFVNHAKIGALWTSILKMVGIGFEHRWTKETYLHYLESQGWKIEFTESITARLSICYVECTSKLLGKQPDEEKSQ